MQNNATECRDCGFVFENEEVNELSQERSPCPNCGSLKRNFNFTAKTKIGVLTGTKLELRRAGSKHKKHRPDYESEQGKKIGKDGELVDKTMIKDRDHPDLPDSYVETVKDKDGNIIVNKHEKLSEHK